MVRPRRAANNHSVYMNRAGPPDNMGTDDVRIETHFRAPVSPWSAPARGPPRPRHDGDLAADVTLGDAQRKLADIGQWLPVDGPAEASLGGLVDVNSTGPLRLGYGAGETCCWAASSPTRRGELITAGGRTVKNVAGYDLTKFMVGQGHVREARDADNPHLPAARRSGAGDTGRT